MSWLRRGMSNAEARAALAQSGNQFDDERILAEVPSWRRSRVRRQAEEARISGTPNQQTWEAGSWESDFYDGLGSDASVTTLDTSGPGADESSWGQPDEAA